MLLRQLFDHESFTYTYLLADQNSCQAVLIDPVDTRLEQYLNLLNELQLSLVAALDTHVHADHVTALGLLREKTGCETYVGEQSGVECASKWVVDGDAIQVGNLTLKAIYTPGHTDDSYSFYLAEQGFLFTGDTLFIRGSGRTDFQNGNPEQLYDSLYSKLLILPGNTVVYPGHDYQGLSQSTLSEELNNNPRLQCTDKAEFVAMMNALDLPQPKHIDVAVPANRACGKRQ
jgi:glyoxylase-like metal-dependent hydrolase (beta-lactamase superfamily II)